MVMESDREFAGKPDRRAKVVVIGNEKGGTGKSTTTLHLAVAAINRGYKVGTIDLDSRQATLSRYIDHRREYAETQTPVAVPENLRLDEPAEADAEANELSARQSIEDALAQLSAYDIVFVDTPGSPSVLSRIGHEYADILITPVNDSLLDIDVLAEIDPVNRKIIAPCHYCRMAWEYGNQRIADGLPPIDWIVIRNRLPHIHSRNREDIDQILKALAHRIGFRLAPGLGERVIFRELFLKGLTALDIPAIAGGRKLSATQQSAIAEVEALFDALSIAPGNLSPVRKEFSASAADR